MNIRPKTVRRLMTLTGIFLFVIVLGSGVLLWHRYTKNKQLRADRDAGIGAYQSGDHVLALDKLKGYVGKFPEDFDALFAYAVARSKVEMKGQQHLKEGRGLFIHLLAMRPDDLATSHKLIELYTSIGYNAEVNDLADKVLARHPEDADALRAKAIALTSQKRYAEALEVSLMLNRIAPRNLAGQLQTRELFCLHLRRTPAAVLEHYKKLQQQYPDDPQFEFLLGLAHDYASDLPNGLAWLRKASQRQNLDAELVRWLSMAFDRIRLFDESQQLLERAASVSKDPAVMRVLVERLWQHNRFEEVIDHLKDLSAGAPTSNADLLAFKAMSLMELQQRDDAQQIIDALKARKGDNSAAAWATALNVRYDDRPDTREAIAKYESAIARDRDNGVIHFWIGEAYLRLGETELGLRSIREAGSLMPSWVGPPLIEARTCIALYRNTEAVEAASLAMRSAPNMTAAVKAYVMAEFQLWLETKDPARVPQLLANVRQIQDHHPSEPETLPIHILLLNRSGDKSAARAAVRAALGDDALLSADLLSKLLTVSRMEQLELDSEILAKVNARLHTSPRLALERALESARSGNILEGLELLLKASDGSPLWRTTICQYRDATNDPAAQTAWATLGDEQPDDIHVQSAILRSGSAVGDRAFYLRTIDRVHKLTGDAGVLWRLHRARFLLAGEDRAKDSAEAVGLLTDLVRLNPASAEYRILLAQGLLNLATNRETTQNAISHLKAAVDLEPDAVSTIITLAKLLQSQGERDAMREYLLRAAKAAPRDVNQRQEIAVMLAQTALPDQAYELLSPVEDQLDAKGRMLLAELARKQGRTEVAERIFKSLLGSTEVEAEALAAAADFYAATGRSADADAALARLDDPKYPAKLRGQILARHHEARGTFDEARRHLIAAAVTGPADVQAWKALIHFDLRNERFDLAMADADEALKAIPSESALENLKAQAAAMKAATGQNADLTALIEVLARDPNNASQVAFLRASQEIRTAKLTIDQAIARLKPVADKYPEQFAAQLLLTQMYVASNRLTDAALVAERTMEALPSDPQPAQMTVGVYQKSGKWREMKRSAEKWRERTPERPMPADLAIAEAQVRMGEFSAALKQIEPYLAPAKANPEAHRGVLRFAAVTMIQSQQLEDARALLEPLLGNTTVRGIWIELAAVIIAPVDPARVWLSKASTQIPVDALQEQLELARAHFTLSQRLDDAVSLQESKTILTKLTEKPDAPLDAIMLLSNINTHSKDFPAAEALLRRALSIQGDLAEAQNNLAYLLSRTSDDLTEAKELAGKAIAAQPDNPVFLDTMAHIQSKLGDRPGAIKSFEQAVKIDPDNLDMLVGLSSVLQADGDKAKVETLLGRIDQLVKQGLKPSPAAQSELDTLRQQVSGTGE